MKLLNIACPIALSIVLSPFAGAMIASVDGVATHNKNATDYVSEIWNRTVYLAAGTGTYLGKSADGTHWVLTAAHVSAGDGTIKTSTGETIGLSNAGTTHYFYNADGTQADLKLFSVSATETNEDRLNKIGNLEIYTGALYTNTPLYCVGTGANLSIGGGISGERVKQWGEFCADGASPDLQQTPSYSYRSPVFQEVFSNKGKSIQCGAQDSGSGAFVKNGNDWELVGVAISVGGVGNSSSVNYYESGDAICATNFVDLSQYASQIYAIIPEPSAFGLLAGMFVLGLAGMRRRR